MEEFNKLKLKLEKCSKDQDEERRHINADEILTKIALNTELSLEERKELVKIYNKIWKYYI